MTTMNDRMVMMAEDSAYFQRTHAFRNAYRRRQLDIGRRGGRIREASGASVGYVGRERADNAQASRDALDRTPAISHMTPGSGLDSPLYAILHWYAQKVVTHLVQPGMYRTGRGGQSDAEWGPRAVLRNEFARTRLGVVYPNSFDAQRERLVHMEQHDPFYIGAKHARGPSTRFFRVLVGLVNHFHLPINTIIAAVWYVSRLALHEGDTKGSELRALLNASRGKGDDVELRVAFLGLCLANRYIEDDSWSVKHYSQQLGIPVSELVRLEFAAVKDMLFSLKFDHEEWQEHLKESMHDIIAPAPIVFHLDQQNVYTLDAALTDSKQREEARRVARLVPAEVRLPLITAPPGFDLRPNECAIDDDEDEDEYCEYDGAKPFITRADLRRASVSPSPPSVHVEEEDEYCEYDGAKPFITNADLRRASDSNRSPLRSWLAGVSENQWQAVPVDAPARLGRVRSRSFLRRNEPVAVADEDYGMDEQDAEDVYRSLAPHYPCSVGSADMHPTSSFESLQSAVLEARAPEHFDAQEAAVPMVQEDSGNVSIDHVEAITVPADDGFFEVEPGVQVISNPHVNHVNPSASAAANARWSCANHPAHHQHFSTVQSWSFD